MFTGISLVLASQRPASPKLLRMLKHSLASSLAMQGGTHLEQAKAIYTEVQYNKALDVTCILMLF